MTLKLYFHPIASYCWKALIALYENETPFEKVLVDLGNAEEREAFAKVWPMRKFPVLRDDARGRTVAESSVIIEYLASYYPGPSQLVPKDPELQWETRMRDRFFDCYVNDAMSKMVGDQLRPPGKTDAFGVEQAITLLETTYATLDADLKTRTWAMGDIFTMADCAAAPALWYANHLVRFDERFEHVTKYFRRLETRPSFARVLEEAKPLMHLFPVKKPLK